jgi:hypothetical protein
VSEDRVAWSRVTRGLYFVGFGTLLLLNTQGIVPWSFWQEAITYWPVGLVALGLRLVFERSRVPALAILGPLLVLGTLTYVAYQGTPAWEREWEEVRAERTAEVERWTFEARLGMVDLDLSTDRLDKSLFVEGRISPAGRRVVRVTTRRDSARVRVARTRRSWNVIGLPARLNKLDLKVAQDLPLQLELDLALSDGDIDLAGVPVSRLNIDGAFNDLALRLDAPASDVRIDLNGAFNHVTLEVPPDTPVRTGTDGFLNVVDGRPGAGSLEGPGYRLDLDGAFNHLVVHSD